MKVKAILTKPLDGMPEGAEREFDRGDFDQLAAYGAVRLASPAVTEPLSTPKPVARRKQEPA